jgi:hypothetical protein
MRFTVSVILAIGIIAILLAAGCADIRTTQQVKDFGTSFGASPEQQKLIDWFKTNYGDPTTNNNQPPRFVLPMVTTGISQDNLPMDNVQIFPKDGGSVYFLVIYDNFKKGDPINVKWVYLANGNEVASVDQQAGDDFGRLIVEFKKPTSGWGVGKQEITVTGKGATAKVDFEIGSEKQTGALPWEGQGTSTLAKVPSGSYRPPMTAINQPGGSTGSTTCLKGQTLCSGICVDLLSSITNCGSCGFVCSVGPNAEVNCWYGECSMRCNNGYADCDKNKSNGCETPIGDINNCGGCGDKCHTDANEVCDKGKCCIPGLNCMPSVGGFPNPVTTTPNPYIGGHPN